GMRSALRSNKLRLHWHMAALAAKIDRLRVLVGLVAAEGSQKKKADGTEREQCENPPVTCPRQNDLEDATFLCNLRRATLLTFVQDRAEKGECEAEEEEKRSDHIREDANVRILCGREEIDREKKDKSEQRRGRQHHASPTEPILKMTPERSGLCWTCSVRH